MKALRARCKPKSVLPGFALALCLAFGGVADASPREVARVGGELIGPRLIEDEVAWIDQGCPDCFLGGTAARFRVFATDRSGDGPPRRLAQGFTESSLGGSVSVFQSVDFDLSSTSLAIQRSETAAAFTGEFYSTLLRFGARGERLPVVFECKSRGSVPYAVDGERVLFVDGCNSETEAVVLVDRRTEERRTIAVISDEARGIRDVALAGDFAAYVLSDRQGAGELVVSGVNGVGGYRVPMALGATTEIDLDASGRLAVLTPALAPDDDACAGTLSWYAPAEPFAHRLPVEPCPVPIAWAGERIAYTGGPASTSTGDELRTVGLDGHDQLGVDAGHVGLHSFDADERALAYGLSACDGGIRLFVLPLSERAGPPPASCPTRLASRKVGVRGRRADVRLACPRGCSGTIRILWRGRKVSRGPFFTQARRRAVHAVRLPRRLRRLVTARGRIAASVRIRSEDRTSQRKVADVTRRVMLVGAPQRR